MPPSAKKPAKKPAAPAKKSPKKAASGKAKPRHGKHTPKIAQASVQELPPLNPQQQQQQQQQPMHLGRVEESEELRQCRREAYNKYLAKCDATCQNNVIKPCIQSSVDQFHKLVMDTVNAGQMESSIASWPVGSLWDRENPPATNAMGPKGKKVLHEYRRCINHTLRSSPEFETLYQKQCGAHIAP
jgi:restriction endonuclease Mrr